jgi:hypothetical protein
MEIAARKEYRIAVSSKQKIQKWQAGYSSFKVAGFLLIRADRLFQYP